MSHQQGKSVSLQPRHDGDHGAAVTIARGEVGSVSVCGCGIVTLTLQYISLRLEPGAFHELQGLLNHAQRRLEGERAHAATPETCGADTAPLH
ncbi:hypothetical protein [Rhodoferax sp.]|uniref:hypothetical protein n=1 Tax=Rhodoferax sp. TaxID=50421 RepID=UPI00276FE72C|nr:hypothetical protein [Reyranella sp.]MDP2371536.1 hypothetical protein [Rhodoferax sp.]